MNFINPTTGLWLIRQLLQFGGAYLVFKGYTDEAGADQAVDALFQLIGPASFLIGFGANMFSSFRAKIVSQGQAVSIPALPSGKQTMVKEIAATAIEKKPTIWERITGQH